MLWRSLGVNESHSSSAKKCPKMSRFAIEAKRNMQNEATAEMRALIAIAFLKMRPATGATAAALRSRSASIFRLTFRCRRAAANRIGQNEPKLVAHFA